MTPSREWTDAELAELQRLDGAGHDADRIADLLDRSTDEIRDHLSIVRAREGSVPGPDPADLEWNGPDEEGDVPPPSGRADDDPGAWVHSEQGH